MIHFNVPPFVGTELDFIREAIDRRKISGDGEFTRKCSEFMEEKFHAKKILLTTSGTSALDMALLLCDLKPGDEVILPSYTFSSTATAAVLTGARLVFIDIRPDTMNIDEEKIERAITPKTRVIIVMHYAGVSCEMKKILAIAKKYNLKIVEDAAQGLMSRYDEKFLGTIGDFGCYSFHETKNLSMGEGGAVVINDERFIHRAEILREKGTNRKQFFRGQVDKYTWVDFGDSYLPSELNAAYLWGQLNAADKIFEDRMTTWKIYREAFENLERDGLIDLQKIPSECQHNAHMFYIKLKNLEERTRFIAFLKMNGVGSVFHYIPLHSAPAGLKFGRFDGEDQFTTKESERLVRLPIYYGMTESDRNHVIEVVQKFFRG